MLHKDFIHHHRPRTGGERKEKNEGENEAEFAHQHSPSLSFGGRNPDREAYRCIASPQNERA